MEEDILQMSKKELSKIEVMEQIKAKIISQKEGAKLLGMSTRWLRNLQHQYDRKGAVALVSKHRGKVSNNRISDADKEVAIKLVSEHYKDFKPTFAHEKLLLNHKDIFTRSFSRETLRQWMMDKGLWYGKTKKHIRAYQLRTRRSSFGEMIQIDGSDHDWFEGRGERCTLIAFIDDATSSITAWEFVQSETTFAYMTVLQQHINRYGIPVSLYSDKHGIFRVNNNKEQNTPTHDTQFSRALKSLNIEGIQAHTPQAKGRVERLFATLQDRLVKELRLAQITDKEQANTFLETYRQTFNDKFAVSPKSAQDAHRINYYKPRELALIFSKQDQRKLSKNLTCQHNNIQYQIQTKAIGYTMRGSSVTVCKLLTDEIVILYKGKEKTYKTYTIGEAIPSIESDKTINHRVDLAVKKAIKNKVKWAPASDHPWRKYPIGKTAYATTRIN
jgi:transposase InsO family protein